MTPGTAALMLLPGKLCLSSSVPFPLSNNACLVGLGVTLAMLVCFWYDGFLAKAKARGKTWASQEEYRRLPLVCIGGPFTAVSQFWLVRRQLPLSCAPQSHFQTIALVI